MEFKIITTIEEMDGLADSWNTLLDSSAIQVPFLRHEYLRIWWQTRGGGEWPKADLLIVAAFENGTVTGIAPLFFSRNRNNETALLLLGSIEVSDYLDVIVKPENLMSFMTGLFEFLDHGDVPSWQVLDWCNILENSPTLAAMEAAAKDKGWVYTCERLQHSPHILLANDWEVYLAGIDKKQRHEIRRKVRRMDESGLTVRSYVVEDRDTLDAEGDAFISLMAQDPEKATFLTPIMRGFMHGVIHCAFDAGCLQLAFLEIDGQKAAAYMNFNYLDRIWVYNSGLNRQFNEYSPGWVLLADLLKRAIAQGAREFDFMRGDEDYKYRFGAADSYVTRAVVKR